MTAAGILMLHREPLDATPNGKPAALSFARIGLMDGVAPHPGGMRHAPRASTDRAGRLYFATVDSTVSIDPATIDQSLRPPPIVVESVRMDDREVDFASTSTFVAPSRVQFDYTSLSLRSPENARFRYRLEGYDADWIEAGGRRHVTYGTLKPGRYRFRVIGAAGEGIWNTDGATVAFVIQPVFWRTWWFTLSVIAIGSAALVGLYRFRVRQLTRQFNIGLEARISERTRIARDLHDTLLQSFQGVLFHFQAATNMLPGRAEEAKDRLEQTLEHGARAIVEGREAVNSLRASTTVSEDFAVALGTFITELAGESGAAMTVNVEGAARPLRPVLRDEVYRIAGEAIRNASRHANARRIQVDIHYDDQHLRLRVRDDGQGFDAGASMSSMTR